MNQIKHNKDSCFLLSCIMIKQQRCATEDFNALCTEIEKDLLEDKDLFDV